MFLFKVAIRNAFSLHLNEPGSDSLARTTLEAYLKMLRRNHVDDDNLQEIARELWRKHKNALIYLADNTPNDIDDVFSKLRDSFKGILSAIEEKGVQVVEDQSENTILRFAFTGWDKIPGFKGNGTWTSSKRFILFEIKRRPDKISCEIYLGPGDEKIRHRLWIACSKAQECKIGTRRETPEWTRIASLPICKLNNEGEIEDIEKEKNDAIKAIIDFAIKRYTVFTKAFNTPEILGMFNSLDEKDALTEPR